MSLSNKSLRLALCGLAISAAFAVAPVAAQPAQPKGLQPVPEPPPMTPGAAESDNEPQVTIRNRGEEVIEEVRVGGRLVMIKVTPRVGPAYVLTDPRGDGTFSQRRDSIDTPPTVPMWVLFTF